LDLPPEHSSNEGILAKVLECGETAETAKRVEFFAKTNEKIFGILHTFFIAYSLEASLLRLAETSANVVQIRSIGSSDGNPHVLQDHLILKRGSDNEVRLDTPYRARIPDIFVPALWTEQMKLKAGDNVIVLRTPEKFSIAPPTSDV
jgi:hypothetical protein